MKSATVMGAIAYFTNFTLHIFSFRSDQHFSIKLQETKSTNKMGTAFININNELDEKQTRKKYLIPKSFKLDIVMCFENTQE